MVGCKNEENGDVFRIFDIDLDPLFDFVSSFPDFVNRLIGDSQRQLHDVFTRTYGVLYERNSALFADYFRRIRSFYSRGAGGSLQEATVKFFTELYRKMFQVLCTRMKTLRF